MITLKINGLDISLEKGTTLLEAARFLGFPIPTLCHIEGRDPIGACRVCLVEVEGARTLVASCSQPAAVAARQTKPPRRRWIRRAR